MVTGVVAMFFRFCSDRRYDEDRWDLVWEIEKAIQALILADLPAIRSSTPDELKDIVGTFLEERKTVFRAEGNRSDLQWVDAFLEAEIPRVREFVEHLPMDADDLRDASGIRDYGLMPNENLSMCMQESALFRLHIQGASRTTCG
jgi:hypothetical protein